MTVDDDWLSRDARLRAALWEAERRLLAREWAHADRALVEAVSLADEPEVIRGLRCLAAAGYKVRDGEVDRARAHLARGRERLAPFLPAFEEVELTSLLAAVSEFVEEQQP